MKKRRIAVISESRATYGYIRRVMSLIDQADDLELKLIVTGMHLLDQFGHSIDEIVKDGFQPEAVVDMYIGGDTPTTWAKSLGVEIMGLAQVLDKIKPDIMLVSGDRAEILAATVTAAYMNVPVAHIQAGDRSGHIDGSARHAISKLAHIHFPACEDSAERVKRMGEEEWRIFNVGAPQLDDLVHGEKLSFDVLSEMFQVDFTKPVLLVIQHPVLAEVDQAGVQMLGTMEAVIQLGHPVIVIYPNVDAAGQKMISVIREYEDLPTIHAYPNLDRKIFLSLLPVVSVLIGNSSTGILEAPSFKLPAIDIGNRQMDRMRANNVITIPEYDQKFIKEAIDKVLYDPVFRAQLNDCRNPYGDGNSSQRICDVLRKIDLHHILVKRMTY